MSLYVDKFELDNQEILIKDSETSQNLKELPLNLRCKIYRDKNILFIGDSWTVGSGSTDPANNRFSTQLANGLEMIEKNYSTGASGFARPLTFQTQAETAISELSQTDKDDTYLIMIVGGVNDLRNRDSESITDVRTAMTQLVTTLSNNFTNATICFAFNMIPTQNTTIMYWLQMFKEHILNMTSKPVMLIDNLQKLVIGRSDLFRNDLLHPTNDGHTLIAGFLKNALLGGTNENFTCYNSIIDINNSDYSLYSGGHIFTNGEKVMIEGVDITTSNPTTSQVVIGTIPQGLRPLSRVPITLYRGSSIVGMGIIHNNGNIYITQSSAGGSFFIPHLEYFIGK